MNILEQEDLVKGLPDQALFQQAENPSGQLPPFLVISEIQRRTDMRKRFESSEAQPQGTVADQIVMEGLGATMPQQAPMSPPPGSMLPQGSMPPPAGFAPSPSPSLSQMEGTFPLMGQGMAAGGILGMSNGGVVRMQSGNRTERQQALVRRRNAGQRADDRNEEKFKKRFGNRFEGQGGHALRSNPDYSEYQRNLQSFLDENREAMSARWEGRRVMMHGWRGTDLRMRFPLTQGRNTLSIVITFRMEMLIQMQQRALI